MVLWGAHPQQGEGHRVTMADCCRTLGMVALETGVKRVEKPGLLKVERWCGQGPVSLENSREAGPETAESRIKNKYAHLPVPCSAQ